MTHWILRFILIAIQVAQPITGGRTDASDPDGVAEKASEFFNYDLCKTPTHEQKSGIGWTCYEPKECTSGNTQDATVLKEIVDVTATCHALLAIQNRQVSNPASGDSGTSLRIVLQIQSDKVTIGSGTRFFYSDEESFSCKFDGNQVEIFKQPIVKYFSVEKEYSLAKFDSVGKKFMCETLLNLAKGKDDDSLMSDKTVGMIWTENGNPITASTTIARMWVAVRETKICNLGDVRFLKAKDDDKVESTHVNMDRNGFTCPAGYVMRMVDKGSEDKAFTPVSTFYCQRPANTFQYTASGQGPLGKARAVLMHCARKLCKQCEKPTCPAAANEKCPTVDQMDADSESCAKLTCASSTTLKLGDKIHKGEPVCENKKWMLDGNEVKNAECATAVSCESSSTAVTVKETDESEMIMDEEEVKCKNERNMTYTADDQTIVLSRVKCDKLEGKWYEERVDPPGSEPYSKEHELRCLGTDGAAAPSKGGLPLLEIGASLAALALIIIVVIIIICCCKRRKAARDSAQKHKLATKSSKSKEGRSKESKSGLSKSNMASSSGAPGVSSDHSVTQKNSKKDREMKSLGIDKSEGAKTAVSIDGTNPKTAAEIKDEERSNPTERSAIPKTEDLNKDANGKKKTAAMLESSKMEDNEEPAQEAVERVQKAMGRKGATRTRNVDGTQAGTTMGPDGTQGPETMDPEGTQAMTAAQQKRRATRKGTFMETGVADPSRGPDGTQQPSENGPDETQNPTGATAETQAATAAGRRTRERTRGTQQTTAGGRRTQGTQNGGDEDDEAEQPLWEPHTAVEKTDEGAGNTGIPRDPTRVRTTQDQTRTKMHTGVHEEESAAIDPPIDDMHTGKEKEKDDDEDSSRMNTAVGKDRKTVDKHTAVEKEDGESKKPKSKKAARQLKPREMELNEKEKKIKAGAKRNRNDYPTMRDIESDWDSDKDKKDGQPRKKKTLEEKKKKKSKQEKEKEKKDSKRKDKEKKDSKKKEKDRKKSKTKEGEVREVTAIDDGPSGVTGNYYTARESTARDGTQNLTPHDPTQAATAATQRTRNKTATIMTTAFDPTETHAAPTIADPTQAATAQDPTQGATTMDRTQGGGTRTRLGTTQGGHTTLFDRTTQGGLTTIGADGTQGMTTVADFTQAHTTGADPTQAGTTIFDRTTQGQTTIGDATTQGETRTRVTGRTRGPSRTQTQTRTRTRADFTQGGTTAADFTQGGATTIADPTQAHNTSADPTQAATTIGGDPTQAMTRVSMDESQETQHQTGTINDPTQLHSAETQEGRTKKSRTKAAFTARTGTRPGTTQSRTKADFTQGATTLADPTQAPTPTAQDPTQGVTTAGDGTQLGTRTKTRTRQQGVTQTATAGDHTQTQTRKDPTQTETRGEETQQGQTEVPGTDGTQIPSKTKTRKTTGKDFTQTATAGDPTQTQTRAGLTQTQTAVDPTHTMTAVDPTRTMTAVDRTRTETKERTGRTRTKGPTQTQTALDPTGTMTAVDRTPVTTAKDRTQTETRAGGTQTQTAVDPTHTMTAVDPTNTQTAVDPTHMTTAKDRTQTETRAGGTQTQTAVDPTRTMTAVDPTHTMTAVDPTGTQTAVDRTRSATKMASRTQTQTAAEQTQTKMERTKTKTARDKTQTQTNADETQAAGATTLGAAETQAMSKPTTAKDRTQTATKGDRTQTATRDKTKEGRTQTSANKTQTTAKYQQTQMTGHETTQGPTTKDPTQTHNDQ